MAIKACKECGNDVSTKAEKCPHCGFVLKRQYGCFSLIIGIVIIGIAVNGVLSFIDDNSVKLARKPVSPKETTPQPKPTQTIKVKTPEEIRYEQIRKAFSSWDGSHTGLEKIIKKSMNDPSSYEHIETRYSDKGDHLVVSSSFRGKNSFGALVKNTVVAKTDIQGNVLEIISK